MVKQFLVIGANGFVGKTLCSDCSYVGMLFVGWCGKELGKVNVAGAENLAWRTGGAAD